MSSHRILRVRELLKRHIGEAIQKELPLDQAGLITVNEVDVSKDLRLAKVFVGILGNPEQQQTALTLLRRHRKRFQSQLADSVVLKYTPRLRFFADDSVTRGNRVLEILDELENSSTDS